VIKRVCSVAVVLAIAGCSSTRVEHRNLTLGGAALSEGGLALLAVTSLGGGEYSASEAMAASFQATFVRLRPAVQIVPVAEVRQGFSKDAYESLLQEADEQGSWTPELLGRFGSLTNRVRFGMVIDIRQSGEHHWSSEHQSFGSALVDVFFSTLIKDYKPSEDSNDITVRGVTRKIGILFAIYDLRSRTPVWAAFASTKMRAQISVPSASPEAVAADPGTPSPLEGLDQVVSSVIKRLPD